jgi:hypothetical protein
MADIFYLFYPVCFHVPVCFIFGYGVKVDNVFISFILHLSVFIRFDGGDIFMFCRIKKFD